MTNLTCPTLPPEILNLICQFSVLSSLKAERRLHVSSSRCSSCGTNRQVFYCPPALLVNSAFRDVGTRVLYRNVFIVIQFDHICVNRDPIDELISRSSILHLITNLELFIRRCATIEARLLRPHDPDTVCRPSAPPFHLFSKLDSALPNLKSVSWTVGVMGQPLPYAALIDQGRRHTGRCLPPGCNSLASILSHKRVWAERITHFRLWLPQATTEDLSSLTYPWTSSPPTAQESQILLYKLRRHAAIKPLLQLVNLEQLDLFLFTSRSAMSCSRPSTRPYPFRSLLQPIGARYAGSEEPPLPPNLRTSRFMIHKERDELHLLLLLLKDLFQHVRAVQFWRIRYGHVVDNAYEKLEFV